MCTVWMVLQQRQSTKLGAENHMLLLKVWCFWWWAYKLKTCWAKRNISKLLCCIKLVLYIMSCNLHVLSSLSYQSYEEKEDSDSKKGERVKEITVFSLCLSLALTHTHIYVQPPLFCSIYTNTHCIYQLKRFWLWCIVIYVADTVHCLRLQKPQHFGE
jgi:hypothetical protein